MSAEGGGRLAIDVSNLLLLLQGKVYEGLACNAIKAKISRAAIAEIHQSVRSRILELTLELEKSIPAAANVSFGAHQHAGTNPEKVQQIVQQIIYGNVTAAVVGSSGTHVDVHIGLHDSDGLIRYLVESGIPREDASELADIVQSEGPTSSEEPFGENAKKWLGTNVKKAAEGTWKVGISVATEVLKEAVL